MGMFYMMAVECADDKSAATAVARHFDRVRLRMPDGSFEAQIETGVDAGQTGRWWAVIAPSGQRGHGSGDREEAGKMTEIGLMLYERLRSAPPFRFAIAGFEVFDFRDAEQLAEVIESPGLDGLVLSETFWNQLGRPSRFLVFEPGYRWIPYRGEGMVRR